jgi:DNA-directed RNA polymerase specialized sigma24 family protein
MEMVPYDPLGEARAFFAKRTDSAAMWPQGTTATPSGVMGATFMRLVVYIRLLVREMVRDRDKADEISQQISIDIWKIRETKDPQYLADPDGIPPFARVAARRRVEDMEKAEKRRAARQGEYVETVEEPRWGFMTAESLLEMKTLEGIVSRVMKSASPLDRSVALRAREDGLSHDRIAEELGLSLRQVKRIVSKMNKRIRIAVERELDSGSDR